MLGDIWGQHGWTVCGVAGQGSSSHILSILAPPSSPAPVPVHASAAERPLAVWADLTQVSVEYSYQPGATVMLHRSPMSRSCSVGEPVTNVRLQPTHLVRAAGGRERAQILVDRPPMQQLMGPL